MYHVCVYLSVIMYLCMYLHMRLIPYCHCSSIKYAFIVIMYRVWFPNLDSRKFTDPKEFILLYRSN